MFRSLQITNKHVRKQICSSRENSSSKNVEMTDEVSMTASASMDGKWETHWSVVVVAAAAGKLATTNEG